MTAEAVPEGYSWMRRAGGARQATMHLLADDPPLDPASDPDLHIVVTACGVLGGLWVHPIAGNVPCATCLAVAPLPNRSPQPPEALPEGVGAEVADFTPYEALGALPEGVTPLFGIAIVSCLHPDGSMSDELAVTGTVTARDAVGTIEAIKFRLMLMAHELIE